MLFGELAIICFAAILIVHLLLMTSRVGDAPSPRDFPQLTGLRGVAALVVVIAHGTDAFLLEKKYFELGEQAVFIFFVLSGFLMGRLYLTKPFTWAAVKGYILSRVGRIFPLCTLLCSS